jgi:hypothetical protein
VSSREHELLVVSFGRTALAEEVALVSTFHLGRCVRRAEMLVFVSIRCPWSGR